MRRLVMTFLASVCLSICGYAEENAPGVSTPASTVDDAISEKLLALELRIVALEARPVVNLKPVFLQPAFPVPPTGEQTPGDPVPSALSEQNIPSPVTVDAMPGDVKVGYEETLLVGDPILLDVVDRPVAVFSKASSAYIRFSFAFSCSSSFSQRSSGTEAPPYFAFHAE